MPLNLLHSHSAYSRCQHAQASFVNFHNSGPYPLQTKEVHVTNLAAGHNLQFCTFYWVLAIQIQSVWLQYHPSLLLNKLLSFGCMSVLSCSSSLNQSIFYRVLLPPVSLCWLML